MESWGDASVGKGARWEGVHIAESLYADFAQGRRKFIAVVIRPCSADHIPDVLRPVGATYYTLPEDDEDLYRRITNQPRVVPAPLGSVLSLEAAPNPR